ncbi:hypothetical protein ACWENQ_44910 [Nonomuraea sp. NPDC004354]
MIKGRLHARLRQILGMAIYCPYCAARLDLGMPTFAIVPVVHVVRGHLPACGSLISPLILAGIQAQEALAKSLPNVIAFRPRETDGKH